MSSDFNTPDIQQYMPQSGLNSIYSTSSHSTTNYPLHIKALSSDLNHTIDPRINTSPNYKTPKNKKNYIKLNGQYIYLLPFDKVIHLFNNDLITSYIFDPNLNKKVKSPNSIITIFGKNNNIYYAKVRFFDSMIYPPL